MHACLCTPLLSTIPCSATHLQSQHHTTMPQPTLKHLPITSPYLFHPDLPLKNVMSLCLCLSQPFALHSLLFSFPSFLPLLRLLLSLHLSTLLLPVPVLTGHGNGVMCLSDGGPGPALLHNRVVLKPEKNLSRKQSRGFYKYFIRRAKMTGTTTDIFRYTFFFL